MRYSLVLMSGREGRQFWKDFRIVSAQMDCQLDNGKLKSLLLTIEGFSNFVDFMYGVFQFIRKRAARKRCVTLLLCLVAIELFCPALCGEQKYPILDSESSKSELSIGFSPQAISDPLEASISVRDDQGKNNQSTVCNDECFCHATAIPSSDIDVKVVSIQSDRILIHYCQAALASVSPPYLPPQRS